MTVQRRLVAATIAAWTIASALTGAEIAGMHRPALHLLSVALAGCLLVCSVLRPRTLSAKLIYEVGFQAGRQHERELRARMASVTPIRERAGGWTPV